MDVLFALSFLRGLMAIGRQPGGTVEVLLFTEVC